MKVIRLKTYKVLRRWFHCLSRESVFSINCILQLFMNKSSKSVTMCRVYCNNSRADISGRNCSRFLSFYFYCTKFMTRKLCQAKGGSCHFTFYKYQITLLKSLIRSWKMKVIFLFLFIQNNRSTKATIRLKWVLAIW